MPGAGARDRKIEFLERGTARDALNAPVETWSVIAWTWAERMTVSDGERIRAQAVEADRTDRFRTPWTRTLAAIDPTYRIQDADGRVYDILAIKEIGRRKELEFTAMARAEAV